MEILRIFAIYLAMVSSQAGAFSAQVDPLGTLPPVTAIPAVTATPVPTQTPRTYKTLSQGARDDTVKKMQEALIRLGYLTGTADGAFGPKTRTAVEEFQAYNGLKSDGVAGNETLQLLFDGSPVRKGQKPVTPSPSPAPVPTPEPKEAYLTVRYQDQWGNVFFEQVLTVTETLIVRADDRVVPEGCVPDQADPVQVLYDARGRVYPAVVVFEYDSPYVPESREIPVRYLLRDEEGTAVLLETFVALSPGESIRVPCDLTLFPEYRLVTAPEGFAVSDEKGNTVPDRIEFVFVKEEK